MFQVLSEFQTTAFECQSEDMSRYQIRDSQSGTAIYSRAVDLKPSPTRGALRFDKFQFHESTGIFVNGSSAGLLWRAGCHVIEVHCLTSLTNHLQGLCRPSGFSGLVQPVSA